MKLTVWHESSTKGYSVRYYDPETGAKKRIYCETYAAVQAKKTEVRAMLREMRAGTGRPSMPVYQAVSDYLAWCKFAGRRSTSLTTKWKMLRPLTVRFTALRDITEASLREWEAHLKTVYSPTTIAMKLINCRAFLNWCVQNGILSRSPFKLRVHIPESTRSSLSHDVKRRIEDEIKPSRRLFFHLLIDCGTRVNETLLARGRDFDLAARTWFIPAAHSKGKRDRCLPLTDRCVDALQLHIGAERVFPGWTHSTVRSALQTASRRAGLQGVRIHPHLFRHTRASEWRGSLPALMDFMGWKSVQMVKTYSHHSTEDLRREASR